MSRPFAVAPRLATWRYACHDAASTMAGLSLLGAGLSLLGAIAAVSRQGVRQWRQANWGKLGQIGEGLELKISWSARVCSAYRVPRPNFIRLGKRSAHTEEKAGKLDRARQATAYALCEKS